MPSLAEAPAFSEPETETSLSDRLFDSSQESSPEQIPQVFIEAFEPKVRPFVPRFVDRLVPENIPVGWVGHRPVIRPVIGREYVLTIQVEPGKEEVVFVDYVHAPGGERDHPLFLVAEKHDGYTGREGRIVRTVPREIAEHLIFSA